MYSTSTNTTVAVTVARYEKLLLGFVQSVDAGYAQSACIALSLGSRVFDTKFKMLTPSSLKKKMGEWGLTNIRAAARELLVTNVVRLLVKSKVFVALKASAPMLVKHIFAFASCSTVHGAIVSIILTTGSTMLLYKFLAEILTRVSSLWSGARKMCYSALRSKQWFMRASRVVALQRGNTLPERKNYALNERLYKIATGTKRKRTNNNTLTNGKNQIDGTKRKRSTKKPMAGTTRTKTRAGRKFLDP
jgi:hypothetical protein